MNTIRSVGYGWAVLIVAGGGSYYFAKRSINADRAERAEMNEKRRQAQYRLQAQEAVNQGAGARGQGSSIRGGSDHPSPSREGDGDPAPVEHAQEAIGRSKYESSEPFRSRKGDRFS